MFSIFFFNDTATTEIYTLSLHDALPIWTILVSSGPILAINPVHTRGSWNRTINRKRSGCHPARSSWDHVENQDTFRKVWSRALPSVPASSTPLLARPRNATHFREMPHGGNLRQQSLPGHRS